MLKISELYIYPIKSLPGISVKQALVTKTGFEHDRRWMLVDKNNLFISQREAPQMTQLLAAIENNGLKITHKINGESFRVPFYPPPAGGRGARAEVVVWDDTCEAEFVSDEADAWFSKMLGMKCRLVYMPDDTRRMVDQTYAPGDVITSFSDGYPFLLIGQASLSDLNSRLAIQLPMDRFRPNIVFTGGKPFAEDLMGNFTIGGIDFQGVKLCARCPIPTINQQDGSRGKEPIKTLASYRQKNNKILFGQNLVHNGEGVIKVGDNLKVLSYNDDERFMVNIPAEKIS
ncbi:MOSC domain-containing protein [Mucilaginibacter gotjawali]|uniref:MOSC domain protein n=2 Tax=Mucilaginibacter gotjawali TaxID=1550579 RepID=A0A0X8X2M0_9SPHI|nr:MOSC N-terminal beta barrel domain-containing protein [Mucilaginibacter gotjawali]MBB3055809.1 hypothetical protein [Mucilaginibacter gotjawali]BAU54630.1 MOSC domain protein [Mucilaginibacter gotjawali]